MRFAILLSIVLAGLLAAASSLANNVSKEEKALSDLAREVALDVEGKKAKDGVKKEAPAMVDKYLKNAEGHKLYRDDELGNEKNNRGIEQALRKNAIADTARAFGSQAGLHWRYNEINEIVERYSGRLDAVNFRPFITDGMILMPSVLVSKDSEDYLSNKKMVKTNIQFIVDEEARIVSVAPTYRNYLIREFAAPKPVNPVLRPKNSFEEDIWREALIEGWEIGVDEAFAIFKDGLLRFERDYQGRINYRKMVQLNMISPAALKVTQNGVTFNGRQMNVGETIYSIVDEANYRTMDEWRSAWLKQTPIKGN